MKIFAVIMSLMFVVAQGAAYAEELPGQNIRTVYEEGMQSFENGDYDTAIDRFQEVLQIKPDMAQMYNLIGLCYMRKKSDPSTIIESFENAIRLDPGNAEPYFNIASLYMGEADDKVLAAEYYEKAIQADPNFTRAYFGLGWIALMENNDAAKARDLFLEVTKRDSEFAEVYFGLGMAYVRLGKKELVLEPISRLRHLGRHDLATQLENLLKEEYLESFQTAPETEPSADIPAPADAAPQAEPTVPSVAEYR